MFQLDRHGFFNLDRIDILLTDAQDQSHHLKPLLEKLDQRMEKFRGKSLWALNLTEISREISALNWVEGHSLSRRWPSGISVQIRPFEVKALFVAKGGQLMPVIRSGDLLDAVEPKVAPDVALLDGDAFQKKKELRRKAITVLEELPKEGTFSQRTVSEIRWDAQDGFWTRVIKSGVDVKLGEDQIGIKAARVTQVLDYLKNRDMHAQSLDANLSKKVLVKLRQSEKSKVDSDAPIELVTQ